MTRRVQRTTIGVAIGYVVLAVMFDLFNATLVMLMLGALYSVKGIIGRAKYLYHRGEWDALVTVMELIAVTVVVGVCIAVLGCNIIYQI